MADWPKELLEARVVFGFEVEDHSPLTEQVLDERASWEEIGRAIGWHGPTAQRHFQQYPERQRKETSS